jgi:hypothetical protein
MRFLKLLVVLSCLCESAHHVVGAEQVTWTSSGDHDENPPLPLSMKQRQQLLQLQQVISTSSDPQGTLQQVAESNGMSAGELMNMLEKNARDLQQDPSLVQPMTIPRAMFRALASVGIVMSQVAKKHPRAFSLAAVAVLLSMYAVIVIPRTGLHVSSGRSFIVSSGPTTIFAPPDRYLHKLISSPTLADRTGLSVKTQKKEWDDLALDGDGVESHLLPRKHELSQAITAQFTLSPDLLLEEFALGETEVELAEERTNIVDLLYSSAVQLLSERRLVEFAGVSDTQFVRSVANADNKMGILVVPGLGNLRRQGLVFWRATEQTETEGAASLTLTTLKGMGFFDGQIHITALKVPEHDGMIMIRVSLAVPHGGRKISKKSGELIVQDIAKALIQSTTRRTQQFLARKSQGRRFKQSASRRADVRRKTRFERERLLEQMAEDRRRRWQRSNPDAGRYRPSGHRQRSPNNC